MKEVDTESQEHGVADLRWFTESQCMDGWVKAHDTGAGVSSDAFSIGTLFYSSIYIIHFYFSKQFYFIFIFTNKKTIPFVTLVCINIDCNFCCAI